MKWFKMGTLYLPGARTAESSAPTVQKQIKKIGTQGLIVGYRNVW
jgi:hypothetical protein